MVNFPAIKKSQRIVIKIGSSLLIAKNEFNFKWLESFADDVLDLKKRGIELIIVASGAVSLGRNYLGIEKEKLKINEKQACAACGQLILMNNFMKAFKKRNNKVAQVLLTFSDTEDRKNSLNSRETINSLLNVGVIPIINENDTVATDELKFGDNDRLASRVAQIISADNLILLSDVKGLYNKNPKSDRSAKLVPLVKEINQNVFKMATNETNLYGSGGMYTKLQAAEIATNFGCNTLICKGNIDNPISCFLKNKIGTWFLSKRKENRGIKNWLAGTIKISGSIMIDDGAVKALNSGASLLPSGVKKISGKFTRGDIIGIIDSKGKKVGKGIVYYDSIEADRIRGKKSSEIKNILGYEGRDEVVHRDYLTLNVK